MTGTLEEAFAQADEQLNNEAAEDEVVDTPEKAEEAPEQETEKEAEPAEDKSEDFTNLNPDELPGELKAVYKSLQADYTRKTQEAANIRKESEKRVEELEKRLRELEQPRRMTPEEQLRNAVRGELEADKVMAFRQQAINDYEQADPRLNRDSEDYDKPTDLYVGQEMDQRLSDHLKQGNSEYTFDYKTALKDVLSDWDEYVQSKNKAFLEKQQAQAKEKAQKVQKQNPKGKSGSSRPKKPSLDEAILLAQQKA